MTEFPPPPPSYGSESYGTPPPQSWSSERRYATWWERVGAAILDGLPLGLASVIGEFTSAGVSMLLLLAGIGFTIWNVVRQGQTGQTVGKGVVGIKVVKDADESLLGAGLSIGRYFVHFLDALPCYLGYFWPLWDAKKQTFADKILSTVVVKA